MSAIERENQPRRLRLARAAGSTALGRSPAPVIPRAFDPTLTPERWMSASFRPFFPVGVKKGQRIDTKPTPNACAWILHDVSERNTMDLISFMHALITFKFQILVFHRFSP
jgi:hypothetical protein